MKIVRYKRADDITIEFQDKHKFQIDTTYVNFKRSINNPYDPRIYGKGYRGVGEVTYIKDGVTNGVYSIWKNILRRCYDETQRVNNPAYEDCEMCDDWCNYQIFGGWHRDSWYDVGEGRMHVDKDILFKGNRLYSPETCILVPQRINMIFMSKPKPSTSTS